jgi:exosortase
LRATPIAPSAAGLVVVIASAALLALGRLGAEFFATRIALIATIAGVIAYAWGLRHLRLLAFPIGALLLMVPPPAIIFNELATPLQMAAAKFGEATLSTAGIPVVREGNLIVLADTTLEVAEACSGIRSLVSLTALAVFYGYFTERRPLARIAIVALAVPIAIAANAFRVAGTGIAAHLAGAQAAEGFFHTFSGWIVFATAFAILLSFSHLLRRMRPEEAAC